MVERPPHRSGRDRAANRVLSEARANATLLGELTQQYQPAPMVRNQIDLRLLFAHPKLVPSHKVIQLDTEEFPEIDEEEDGLYQGSAGRGRGHDLRISARAARRLDLGTVAYMSPASKL